MHLPAGENWVLCLYENIKYKEWDILYLHFILRKNLWFPMGKSVRMVTGEIWKGFYENKRNSDRCFVPSALPAL